MQIATGSTCNAGEGLGGQGQAILAYDALQGLFCVGLGDRVQVDLQSISTFDKCAYILQWEAALVSKTPDVCISSACWAVLVYVELEGQLLSLGFR